MQLEILSFWCPQSLTDSNFSNSMIMWLRRFVKSIMIQIYALSQLHLILHSIQDSLTHPEEINIEINQCYAIIMKVHLSNQWKLCTPNWEIWNGWVFLYWWVSSEEIQKLDNLLRIIFNPTSGGNTKISVRTGEVQENLHSISPKRMEDLAWLILMVVLINPKFQMLLELPYIKQQDIWKLWLTEYKLGISMLYTKQRQGEHLFYTSARIEYIRMVIVWMLVLESKL